MAFADDYYYERQFSPIQSSSDSEEEDLAKIDTLLDHFTLAVENVKNQPSTDITQDAILHLKLILPSVVSHRYWITGRRDMVDYYQDRSAFTIARDQLIFKLFQLMEKSEIFEFNMDIMQMLQSICVRDATFSPFPITSEYIPALIKLLTSPYEELAIKSMDLLMQCAEEILITKIDHIHKIADVIAKGRSTQFLRYAASFVYACMKYLYQSPHIIPLLQIVTILIRSDDIKVLKEILKAWTVVMINRHTIFSYIRDEMDDELWQLNMDLIPTGYACEIIASQSLSLKNPIVELLFCAIDKISYNENKFLLDGKVLSYLHNLLRQPGTHTASNLSEILTIINRLIYHGYDLVQKMIDEDLVSTIFRCSDMLPNLDSKMITCIFADMINFGSDDQVRYLVKKNDRMIIYLFNSLISQNKYKNMMPSFLGLHSAITKCKWLPNLSKKMKSDVLAQLQIIRKNGQQGVSELATELYNFIETSNRTKLISK